MRGRQSGRDRSGRARAFTLVELLVVMAIIGIIIAFVLSAAMDGVRRAEERGTQALIAKLEAGMTDRMDAIVGVRPDVNLAHHFLAATFSSNAVPVPIPSDQRAQIIARFDQVKADTPDVFVVQNDTNYPLNFGAAPFPASAGTAASVGSVTATYCQYLLPFGTGMMYAPGAATPSFGDNQGTSPPYSTGIFGASYTAASGVYKSLVAAAVAAGATPPTPPNAGYDGVDNNGNGLIDELGENGASVAKAVVGLLANHTHKTARSEMLYALLVEGEGPFGSVFSRDDFSDSEVKDTDGDGLPEFVDAWGEPLQFYRWPVFFPTDTQKGANLYSTTSFTANGASITTSFETRQLYQLDPQQKLVDPFWWSGGGSAAQPANDMAPYTGTGTGLPLSPSAYAFQALFTTLTDPNAGAGATAGALWDKGSGAPARRSYYSRFLILSGGADKTPGVPVFDPSYYPNLSVSVPSGPPVFAGSSPIAIPTEVDPKKDANIAAIQFLRIESQAAPATYIRTNSTYYTFSNGTTGLIFPPADAVSLAIADAGADDVTNFNLHAPGGSTQ